MKQLKESVEVAREYLTNKQLEQRSLSEQRLVDEVGKFWVVTKPTGKSELVDILFETTILNLFLNIRGGLKEKDIVGFYKRESKAKKVAQDLLKKQ